MTRLPLVLLLAACAAVPLAPPSAALAPERAGVPPVLSFGALVAGTPAVLTVTQLDPGETVRIARGTPGAGPCLPAYGGLCVDLTPGRLVGSGIADGAGVAEVLVPVPAGAAGRERSFQAFVQRGAGGVDSLKSVVVTGEVADPADVVALADLAPGDLVISEIMTYPWTWSTDGKWFEVLNARAAAVDLDGLEVDDGGLGGFTVAGALVLGPGRRAVFGATADTALNGGVAVDYAYGSGLMLSTWSGELRLLVAGTVIDAVEYAPSVLGEAHALSADLEDADYNDLRTSWCAPTESYDGTNLGTPGAPNAACPVDPTCAPVVRELALGAEHACARSSAGELWCWGSNRSDQLSMGPWDDWAWPTPMRNFWQSYEPVTKFGAGRSKTCMVSGSSVYCTSGSGLVAAAGASAIGSSTAFAYGDDHGATSTYITNDSTFFGTSNAYGELFVEPGGEDVWAGGVSADLSIDFDGFAIGHDFTCADEGYGGVTCHGRNDRGQLGNGTLVDGGFGSSVPSFAADLDDLAAGWAHACALEGAAWCWGANDRGQLGDGSQVDRTFPVAVVGLPAAPVDVAAGYAHTCAALADGTVWCWGANDRGQLGHGGAEAERLEPVQVAGLAGAVTIEAGDDFTCAVTGTGGVWCWGAGTEGQLGDAHWVDRGTAAPVFWACLP